MNINRAVLAASWASWISNDNRYRSGPWWLQWVWTFLFCASLAVAFTVFGFVSNAGLADQLGDPQVWAYWYGKNLVVSLTIGVLIHLLFDATRSLWATPLRVRSWRHWQRTLFFSGIPLLGMVVGWPLGVWLTGADLGAAIASRSGNRLILGTVFTLLVLSFIFHHYFSAKAGEAEAQKRATEAQMRLLQAQIEPHFLFNTLANVQSLMDHDLPKAKQMLSSFTDYLRGSLGALRSERSPLAQELALAQNYLQLLQARMEDRLQFSISADEATRQLPLPPLLLQPLIENAVVHGIEPNIAGGTVRVSAQLLAGQLVLEVQDDGRGLDAAPRRSATPGAGMALANIRQRLQAHYGAEATLEVKATHPGTLARITLPVEGAAS